MGDQARETMIVTPKMYELGDVWLLLEPRYSQCVKSICQQLDDGSFTVECTLPLNVETAVGLQILGDRAMADPDLELTILASLEGEA